MRQVESDAGRWKEKEGAQEQREVKAVFLLVGILSYFLGKVSAHISDFIPENKH